MLVSFALMIISSIIASWGDITAIFAPTNGAADSAILADTKPSYAMLGGFNIGYFWMLLNCLASAGYVSLQLPT